MKDNSYSFSIVRDGKDIPLTYEEIYKIHNYYDFRCKEEDVSLHLEERDDCSELNELDVAIIAKLSEKTLDNNDSYWESYWLSIDYTIDEYIKQQKANGRIK